MKGTLVLTMGVITALTLVGCGANNLAGPGALPAVPGTTATKEAQKDAFLGVWHLTIGEVEPVTPPQIGFREGGQMDVTVSAGSEGSVTVYGAYKVDGDKLIMSARDDQAIFNFTTYTYTIEDNAMTLKDARGGATKWVKS